MEELHTESSGRLDSFVEKVLEYRPEWEERYDVAESVSKDSDFVYLEIEADEDLSEDFMDIGNALNARVIGGVNSGERYFLSVSKKAL